ncbi:uncharacterized protein N7482_004573 [Penicillium canariense]|uniref:NodB homology domain-containing protein n=1 Tax=Penicillium canariense TaxID=189055 RepID=A0A9W9I8Y2_9EURO|nr:uncharacterized protein N7482_004573 [Penicillium canariense]KAJ5168979.1 hypothetical protein N7482_004573 [Penicillium canariense]
MHSFSFLAAVLLSIIARSSAAAVPRSPDSQPRLPIQTSKANTNAPQLPWGAVINHCTVPGTIALAFDDGPYIYTEQVLDALAAHGVRATFFLNGAWKGNIHALAHVVQRILAEGHQIGSHTWSHPNLTTLTHPAIVSEMIQLEDAFLRILGFMPTYMRTPWLHVNDIVLSAMADLGYHVIGASIVTDDKQHDHPARSWRSFEKFRTELGNGGSIVLAHDSQENTAGILVPRMLEEVRARGLQAVTVGECLGHPSALWYRSGQ